MDPRFISLIIFIICYVLFIFLPQRRTLVAVLGAAALIGARALSINEAFSAVNWNVMGIFVGTLFVADIFMESKAPAHIAEVIVDKSKNTCFAILAICLLTGFISAFVENVATVLIVAPIALSLADKLKINPINMMIAIAISSNLQGTATLIGDPPSMLLGGFAGLNFGDFFFYHGKPGIFFAVEIGALFSFIVLYYLFNNYKDKVNIIRTEKIKSLVPSILLVTLVILLASSSFFEKASGYLPGTLCMVFGAISLAWKKLSSKVSILKSLKELDWETTFFLMGIFILVGSLTSTGWIDSFSRHLSGAIGGNILLGYLSIVVLSVFLSAFIDNVPFLAAMLPLTSGVADKLHISPYLFLFGLLIGCSVGGNITPIGASANIVACGLLKERKYHVSFLDFVKIGLPFTLAAVIPACAFLWFVWR